MTEKKEQPLIFRVIKAPASALMCSPPEKMVLTSYVSALNPPRNGTLAWPGLECIAEQTGLNEKTVRRAIARLCEHDLIKLHRRTARCKIYAVNVGLIHRLIEESGQKAHSPALVTGQRVHSRLDTESTREWAESPPKSKREQPREQPTGNSSFGCSATVEVVDDPVQRQLAVHQVVSQAAKRMRLDRHEQPTKEKKPDRPEPDGPALATGTLGPKERPG